MTAPEHIQDYCKEIDEQSVFYDLYESFSDEYTFLYKIVCTCGCDEFSVCTDEHPTAIAECTSCKNKFTLYDLALYPNAFKLSKQYEMKKFRSESGSEIFKLCTMFEYSDEFDFDDEEFDVNDITAFSLFAFDPSDGEKLTIIDDETA